MWRKMKKLGALLIIGMLLPYVITIFMNGESVQTEKESILDEYCIVQLAKEVSSEYEDEMLKAQAVIVRTSIYREIKSLDKDSLKGVLEDCELDKEWQQRLMRVWQETEGQVLLYNEELALLPFHQLSNGKTRSGQEVLGEDTYPYLKVKDCEKDVGADSQMQTKVIEVAGIAIVTRDSAGYVTEVTVGEETCSGDAFRDTYELASSCFDVQEFDGRTRVITKGVGHGLGMSQYTANEMAKSGKTYKEILDYFFEGTEMREVAEVLWNMD